MAEAVRLAIASFMRIPRLLRSNPANERASFLASAGRELALSLEHEVARETIRRRTLPRDGSWCIVDLVERDGAVRRLEVAHPNPSKQAAAQTFADRFFPVPATLAVRPDRNRGLSRPDINAGVRRELGFDDVLVLPLVARAKVVGAITFVASHGDAPFSRDEISLASDLADLCALALDNERLYREARALRETADDANRAKSTFLSTMSHELMTPLNAIGGYVSLLEMGLRGPISPEQLTDLSRIRHNQEHLVRLIADVLTFASGEGGRIEYQLAAVSCDALLAEVSEMLRGAAEGRQLSLVHHADASCAPVCADPDRVRQILINLVMNAIKYATSGGRVALSCATVGGAVAVHVADSGPGIPADKLQSIFQPFVQLASGAGGRRGGVGLGLSISRDMARAMKGDLTVVSAMPGGSTFTLTLPALARGARARVS
jgi:signal transduction histidine kinase